MTAACGHSIDATYGGKCQIPECAADRNTLSAALDGLIINANRLCDRVLGGTYEEDCRRSISKARAALAAFRAVANTK